MLTVAKYESKLIQGSLGMSQVSRSQRMRSCAVSTSHIESRNESEQRYNVDDEILQFGGREMTIRRARKRTSIGSHMCLLLVIRFDESLLTLAA